MIEIDLQTVRAAQRGDEDAARTLIDRLHRPILATAYRFLGPRYREEIEDIGQEIFLKIFRSLDRFDPDRGVKFTTWVYAFVRNHCFDVQKKKRLPATSLTGVEDEQIEVDAEAPTPEAEAEQTELGARIEAAVATLADDQRMAFILREYEGLDYAQIAEVMDVSEGTIKSRLHRAKQSLRRRLEPYLRTGA
jgi:RNA polymerase sigma-70 factor (ECF subfamily)